MTEQEIFDTVARALKKQGRPSAREEFGIVNCYYRSGDGLRCAAGHLISDAEYSPELEGSRVFGSRPDWEPFRSRFSAGQQDLIRDLQNAHDESTKDFSWCDAWASRMRALAGHYGLSTAALDEDVP